MPEPFEARAKDGTRLLVRPLVASDKELLVDGFQRLSERTRYLRFFTGLPRLPDKLASYLTDIDQVDHFAWAALDIDVEPPLGVGVARYIRTDDPEAAEAAIVVVDDYQRRGIGSLLFQALARVAWANGVRRFSAALLVENRGMRRMLDGVGATFRTEEPGVVRADLPLERFVST